MDSISSAHGRTAGGRILWTMLDGWDHYECLSDGQPARVRVDLDAETAAPTSGLGRLVCVRVGAEDPSADFERELVERLARGRYVARVQTAGRSEHHFYLPDDQGVRAAVEAALRNHALEGEVSATDDADWEWFLRTLLPSALERQKMRNRRQLKDLAPVGAVLVKHSLLFPTAIARDAALAALLRRGFTMQGPYDADGVLRFGLILAQTTELNAESLDRAVEVLHEVAEEQGGAYLEWTV